MYKKDLTILVIEDNELDAKRISGCLVSSSIKASYAGSLSEALKFLSGEYLFDAILLDLNLPDSEGINTFEAVYNRAPLIPIVILSVIEDDDVIYDSLHKGVQDYLFKTQINKESLLRSIRYATERKQTLLKLNEAEISSVKSKKQLTEAMDLAQLYNWEYDIESSSFVFDEKIWKFLGKGEVAPGLYRMPILEFLEKFIHPDDKEILINDRLKAQTTTDPNFMSQVEYRIILLDESIRHIVVRTRVEIDSSGKPARYFGIMQDITDRKIAIQEAFEALNQLNDVKTEFLSLISQEIRTPINAIVGAVNLIKNQEGSLAIKDLVENLDKSVSNLEAFTDNTIYYSKLTNNYSLKTSIFSLQDLVKFAILECENAIVEKNLQVLFEASSTNAGIVADKDLIYKAVLNILRVFASLSKPGKSILIDIVDDPDYTICAFSSSGNTISADIVDNYMSISGIYQNKQAGLSLFVVLQIMNIHKGKFKVMNHEERGATMKLMFKK
jgi:signal transduction histidine kinase/CheY-like chemotaxis protein